MMRGEDAAFGRRRRARRDGLPRAPGRMPPTGRRMTPNAILAPLPLGPPAGCRRSAHAERQLSDAVRFFLCAAAGIVAGEVPRKTFVDAARSSKKAS